MDLPLGDRSGACRRHRLLYRRCAIAKQFSRAFCRPLDRHHYGGGDGSPLALCLLHGRAEKAASSRPSRRPRLRRRGVVGGFSGDPHSRGHRAGEKRHSPALRSGDHSLRAGENVRFRHRKLQSLRQCAQAPIDASRKIFRLHTRSHTLHRGNLHAQGQNARAPSRLCSRQSQYAGGQLQRLRLSRPLFGGAGHRLCLRGAIPL